MVAGATDGYYELNLEELSSHADLVEREPPNNNLEQALAENHGVAKENILVSDSSLGLAKAIIQGVDGPVGILVPDYHEYKSYCQQPRMIERTDGFDIPEISDVEAVVLSNPNNPTGTHHELSQIVERTQSLLIVDEAYIDFIGEERSLATHLRSNLVVLRTFSKFYGVKVGYAVGPADLLQSIDANRPDEPELRRARAMLDHPMKDEAWQNACGRRRFLKGILHELGCETVDSCTNFVMAKRPYGDLVRVMKDLNVRVLDLNRTEGIQLQGYCGVAVGSYDQLIELQRRVRSCQYAQAL